MSIVPLSVASSFLDSWQVRIALCLLEGLTFEEEGEE